MGHYSISSEQLMMPSSSLTEPPPFLVMEEMLCWSWKIPERPLPRKSLWRSDCPAPFFYLWRSLHTSAKFILWGLCEDGDFTNSSFDKFLLGDIMDVDGENASCQDYSPLRMWSLRVWKLSSAF